MGTMTEHTVPRLEGRMAKLFGFFLERAVARKAKLAAAFRQLEFFRTGMRVMAGGAIAVFDWTVDADLGKLGFLFDMAAIAEIGSLKSQELGKLRGMWIVAAFAGPHFHGRMDVGLREFLLQLRVALEAQLRSLCFERHGPLRASG